mgnify:CR=1 FL=1
MPLNCFMDCDIDNETTRVPDTTPKYTLLYMYNNKLSV